MSGAGFGSQSSAGGSSLCQFGTKTAWCCRYGNLGEGRRSLLLGVWGLVVGPQPGRLTPASSTFPNAHDAFCIPASLKQINSPAEYDAGAGRAPSHYLSE